MDQGRISGIERGVRRLRDVAVVAQVATALCIPAILLGFGDPGTTVGVARVQGRKVVSWMERRDFCDLAVAQLRATLPLLGAQMTDEVRPRLYLVGHLGAWRCRRVG